MKATISMEGELKSATIKPIVQCVMKDGMIVMLQSYAINWDTAITVSCFYSSLLLLLLYLITAPMATGGMTFGLSDETPVLQNLMCNGTEYSLSSCTGYQLNNVSGSYCLSGNYQAGVRCVNGKRHYSDCRM